MTGPGAVPRSDPGCDPRSEEPALEDQTLAIYTPGSVSSVMGRDAMVRALKQLSQSDAASPIFCLINDKFLLLFPCARYLVIFITPGPGSPGSG